MNASFLFRLSTLLALSALAVAVRAETISGGSLSYTGATDYDRRLGFLSKFDGSKGTLTGVALTAGYGFNSTITVITGFTARGTVATESAANFRSTDAGVLAVLNSLINTAPNATIGSSTLSPTAFDYTGPTSSYFIGAGSGFDYQSNVAHSSATYNALPSQFAAFYASGGSTDFDVSGRTLTGVRLTSDVFPGAVFAYDTTRATQTISVLYTYTPVPEPASMLALGAGALGLLRRRKRA